MAASRWGRRRYCGQNHENLWATAGHFAASAMTAQRPGAAPPARQEAHVSALGGMAQARWPGCPHLHDEVVLASIDNPCRLHDFQRSA